MNRLFGASLGTLFLIFTASCNAATSAIPPTLVDGKWLAARQVDVNGILVKAWHIADRDGEHALVLARKAGPSPSAPRSGRIEHIDLQATYYSHARGRWTPAWTIRDAVDCPGLDADADFFSHVIGFTDLDGDGRVEITVPYHLFCGGGVDSRTVKVIMRDGATKLAVRGASRVELPGQAPFGGEYRFDDALLRPERAAYKRFLAQIWNEVSVDRNQ